MVRTEVDLDSLFASRRRSGGAGHVRRSRHAVLIDKNTGELVSRAAHLPELPEIRLPPGQASLAMSGRADARSPPRTPTIIRALPGIDRITGYKTVTVLPLR